MHKIINLLHIFLCISNFVPKRFGKMKFEKLNCMILSQVTYLPRKDGLHFVNQACNSFFFPITIRYYFTFLKEINTTVKEKNVPFLETFVLDQMSTMRALGFLVVLAEVQSVRPKTQPVRFALGFDVSGGNDVRIGAISIDKRPVATKTQLVPRFQVVYVLCCLLKRVRNRFHELYKY